MIEKKLLMLCLPLLLENNLCKSVKYLALKSNKILRVNAYFVLRTHLITYRPSKSIS